jgi:LysR family glycine cleavage system transcriptional activator
LSLTQSAVSRQVQVVESQLGVHLLVRTSRSVRLTTQGGAYAADVRAALEALRAAALTAMGADRGDELTLAILPTFGTRWLMPRIPAFVRRHPEVTLSFATRIGTFDLTAAGVDAAIHSGQPDWPGGRCTLLLEEQVMPVASPAFLRAHPVVSPPDLLHHPILTLASRPGAWVDWMAGQGLNWSGRGAMVFEHISTLAQACAAGLGVALMPAFLIRPELDSGALVALAPERANGNGYYFVQPETRNPKRATTQFRDWLLTEVARADGPFA